MFCVNCSFACAYDARVHLPPVGTAKSSMCVIQIAVRSSCFSIGMSSKFSVMLYVFVDVSDSGVNVNKSSISILFR